MELTYLDYLFLGLFSTKESRKLSSVYHIMTGKRTISVLLQSIRLDLSPYFSLFPKLKFDFFEQRIDQLVSNGLLTSNLFLSSEGERKCEIYFQKHFSPSNKARLKYQTVLGPFKKRSLFLTQVASQIAHANNKYAPIQPRISEQLWLKNFLLDYQLHRNPQLLGKEWIGIIAQAKIKKPEIFVSQFEGFGQTRLTNSQLGKKYELDTVEIFVTLDHEWLRIIETAIEHKGDYPLLYAIINDLTETIGLSSESASESYRMWQSGFTIEQICQERSLKISTINDHFTEIALIDGDFPYESFLSQEQMRYIDDQLDKGPIDYRKIQEQFPGITFFESRLMQVKGETSYVRK